MGLTINEMVKEAGDASKSKGFHSVPTTVGDLLMLIVTEVAEAMEDYRKPIESDYPMNQHYYVEKGATTDAIFLERDYTFNYDAPLKPCGFPSELADIVIRVGDLAYRYDIDLEEAIKQKMAYNRTRGHMHGGKKI